MSARDYAGYKNGIECCVQCGEPKFPQRMIAGDEVKVGWAACINQQCICFGDQVASATYRDGLETCLELQHRLNDLRCSIGETHE